MSEDYGLITGVEYIDVVSVNVDLFETYNYLFKPMLFISHHIDTCITNVQLVFPFDYVLTVESFLAILTDYYWSSFVHSEKVVAEFAHTFVGEDVEAALVINCSLDGSYFEVLINVYLSTVQVPHEIYINGIGCRSHEENLLALVYNKKVWLFVQRCKEAMNHLDLLLFDIEFDDSVFLCKYQVICLL